MCSPRLHVVVVTVLSQLYLCVSGLAPGGAVVDLCVSGLAPGGARAAVAGSGLAPGGAHECCCCWQASFHSHSVSVADDSSEHTRSRDRSAQLVILHACIIVVCYYSNTDFFDVSCNVEREVCTYS